MVAHAKNLANRSVLIDHCGLENINLAEEFNNVQHVYSIEKETRRGLSRLSLIEFKSLDDAERVVKQTKHNDGLLPVPLKILRHSGYRPRNLPSQLNLPFPIERVRLPLDKELSPEFSSYTELIANNMMSLVSLKLRFITLVNFERILCSGMFEEYELMPFGSSVSDMGCDSGDLDLMLTRKEDHYQSILNASNLSPQKSSGAQTFSNLVHLDRSLYHETKDQSGKRGVMRWFDHILKEYMPLTDASGVLCLSQAKVPIIKFTSRVTNIECDLSFDFGFDHRDELPVNPGILMTEILYQLCRKNNLISGFVIYLRIFSKLNTITSKTPGIGMTNFQFLSLIIFFLQQVSIRTSQRLAITSESPEIQSRTINDTIEHQGACYSVTVVLPEERRTLDNEPAIPPFRELVNGNFLTGTMTSTHFSDEDLNVLMPELIVKFFQFYSKFDFAKHSLNLLEGRRDRKLDNSNIFVLNPIDTKRNICHNVNKKGLDHLVNQSKITLNRFDRHSECPLGLIRNLLIKNQKQNKKSRALPHDDLDLCPITPEGIAQEVCR